MNIFRKGDKGGPDALPSPRQLKRRAVDLLREARRLHKRKAKRIEPSGAQLVAERIDAVERLLPSRKNPVEFDSASMNKATIALDQTLSAHYGKWRKSPFRELIEALAMAVLLAAVIRLFLVEAFSIPSSSMYPTLEIGDHLFISKIRYGIYAPLSTKRMVAWDEPKHGDVIVFEHRAPGRSHDGDDFIKRVIAVAGDRIRLENNILILNGKPVQTEVGPETTCKLFGNNDYDDTATAQCPCILQRETIGSVSWQSQHFIDSECADGRIQRLGDWPGNDNNPNYRWIEPSNRDGDDIIVPEGSVFVMGDNRDNSQDGRFWGFVPFDRIKGKAFVIWWARDFSRLLNGMN